MDGNMDDQHEYSEDIKAQEKALRHSKKEARQWAEAGALILPEDGQRNAKKRALANTIWIDDDAKKQHLEQEESADKARASSTKHRRQSEPQSEPRQLCKSTVRTNEKAPDSHPPAPRIISQPSAKPAQCRSPSDESEHSHASSETSDSSTTDDADGADVDEDDEENDDDLVGLSDSEGKKVMHREMPMIVPRGSSSPVQATARAKSHQKSRHRSLSPGLSPPSRPPTSESDGLRAHNTLLECTESYSDEDIAPLHISQGSSAKPKPARSSKSQAASQAKFLEECPTISKVNIKNQDPKRRVPAQEKRQGTVKQESGHQSDNEVVDDEAMAWPKHARLRGTGVLDQCLHIRLICKEAIRIAEATIVTTDAWLELHRVAEYRVEVLVQAAKTLGKTDSLYRDIKKRVQKDDEFARIIGKWVTDHLPHARGRAHSDALDHIAIFQLGIGRTCEARMKALFADDTYVYPGHWEESTAGKPTWVVKGKEMYLNPGLINVLRSAFFATPTAFGFKFKEHYVSSHPDRSEKELTIPLVALAATGIHAALDAWKGGNYIKKASNKFDGDTYKAIFQHHIHYLEGFKVKSVNAYHSVMAELYLKVIGHRNAEASHQAQGNALAVLDLSGFD